MKVHLSFSHPELVASSSDAIEYIFPYEFVESNLLGKPEEVSETSYYKIKVSITDTLASMWQLSTDDLLKVLYEYVKRELEKAIIEGSITDNKEYSLSTDSHPKKNPFDFTRIHYLESIDIETEWNIKADSGQKSEESETKQTEKKSDANEGSSKQEQTNKNELNLWLKKQFDIAWKLYEKEEYKKAKEICEPAIEKARNNKFHKIQGDLLDVWVKSQIKLLSYSEAEDGIEQMLSLGDLNNFNVLKAKALYDRALIQKRQNNLKSAIESNKVAIGLFKKEEDPELYTNIRLWLSGEGVQEFMSARQKKSKKDKANKTINEIEKLAKDERGSKSVGEKNELDVSLFLIENSISEDKLDEALNVIIDLPNRVDISSYEKKIAELYKIIIDNAISKNQIKIAVEASHYLADLAETKKQELTAIAHFYQAKVAFAENNIEESKDFIFTIIFELYDLFDAPLLTEIYRWLMEVNFPNADLIDIVKESLTQVLTDKPSQPKDEAKYIPGTDSNIDAEIEAYFDNDQEAEGDLFLGYEEYADAFVSFIDGEEYVDQLVIGLHGEWGRGKSTLMGKIKEKLESQKYVTAKLNAWKYHKEENIWAAFLQTVLDQMKRNLKIWWKPIYYLSLFRHAKPIKGILVFLFIAGLLIAIYFKSIWILFPISSVPAYKILKKLAKIVRESLNKADWFKSKIFERYDYTNSLGVVGKMNADLLKLTKVFSRVYRKKSPIIIFIDDLDRCPPNRIVEVINAINTLTLSEGFIFFLGYDRKYVASAICAEYKEMIGFYDEQNRDKLQFGYEFLDKIIQIPFRIPVGSSTEIHNFVMERLKLKIEHYLEPYEIVTVEPAVIIPESRGNVKNISQEGESEKDSERKSEESDTGIDEPKDKISKDILNEITGSILKSAVKNYRLTNPRKIKKFINTFKLMSYIALERRAGGNGKFPLKQLGFLMFFESNYPAELNSILDGNKKTDNVEHENSEESNKDDKNEVEINEDIKRKMLEDLLNLFNVKKVEDLKENTAYVMDFISGSLT